MAAEWSYPLRTTPESARGARLLTRCKTPLRLQYLGTWDPAEEYWGEPGEAIDPVFDDIIAAGPRPECEMEQVLPGQDPQDLDDDIVRSAELHRAGYPDDARALLRAMIAQDPRCIDAHAHLGNLYFRTNPKAALAHYQTGVAIGERALPPRYGGVLPWGWIDNRPFLRALNGMAICLWRLKRFDEAAAAIDAQLWLTPSDQVGARFLRDAIRDRVPWKHEDDDDGR